MSTPKFRFQIDQFLTSPIFKILSFFVSSKVTSQKVGRLLQVEFVPNKHRETPPPTLPVRFGTLTLQ